MKRYSLLVAIVIATGATSTSAAPAVNGTLVGDESFYGTPKSIQNTDTGFGNSNRDDLLYANGSEIDQVFATVSGDRLYVLITGNLETNFNKLEVFVDSVAGGVNTLDGANLPRGVDPFSFSPGGGFPNIPPGNNPTNNGALQAMNGLTFDAGFQADYYLTFTHGTEDGLVPNDPNTTENEQTRFYAMSAHYADLTNGTAGNTAFAGITFAPDGLPNVLRSEGTGLADPTFVPNPPDFPTSIAIGPALPGLEPAQPVDRTYASSANGGCTSPSGVGCVAPELEFVLPVDPNDNAFGGVNESDHRDALNTVGLRMAVNNSNFLGVDNLSVGFPETFGNPQDVVTGVEFSIPLSQIGGAGIGEELKVTVFVNGSGHDFASNQFGGVGVLAGNLGSNGSGVFTENQLNFSLATVAGNQFITVENTFVPPSADYNGDGIVNAADYTVWRDGGSPDDTIAGYNLWKANFGNSGGGAGNAVPEPAMIGLVLLGMLSFSVANRR